MINDKIERVRKYCECSTAYAHCFGKYATYVMLGQRHIVNQAFKGRGGYPIETSYHFIYQNTI